MAVFLDQMMVVKLGQKQVDGRVVFKFILQLTDEKIQGLKETL